MSTPHAAGPPAIELWYGDEMHFGRGARPSRWANVPGRVIVPAGLHDLRWRLNDERHAYPLSVGPTAYRLVRSGDFNIEFDLDRLAIGSNRIKIDATDRNGERVAREIACHRHQEDAPSTTLKLDFARCDRIDRYGQVVDGRWRLEADGLRTAEIGYDRIIAFGDRAWTDYNVRLTFTVHRYSDDPLAYMLPSCGSLVGFIIRWTGHVNWHDLVPYRGYRPFGMIAVHATQFNRKTRFGLYGNDDRLHPAEADTVTLPVGRRYAMAAQVASGADGPATYRMNAWPVDQSEPDGWMFEETGTADELPAGAVVLLAHQADVTFHDLEIRPLRP